MLTNGWQEQYSPVAGNNHPEHIQDCNVEQVLHEDRLTLPASVKVIIISSSLSWLPFSEELCKLVRLLNQNTLQTLPSRQVKQANVKSKVWNSNILEVKQSKVSLREFKTTHFPKPKSFRVFRMNRRWFFHSSPSLKISLNCSQVLSNISFEVLTLVCFQAFWIYKQNCQDVLKLVKSFKDGVEGW